LSVEHPAVLPLRPFGRPRIRKHHTPKSRAGGERGGRERERERALLGIMILEEEDLFIFQEQLNRSCYCPAVINCIQVHSFLFLKEQIKDNIISA
jgi:hypothetical protein